MLALIIQSFYNDDEGQVESEQFRAVFGPWPGHSRSVNQCSLGHRSCICRATDDLGKVLGFSIFAPCLSADDS